MKLYVSKLGNDADQYAVVCEGTGRTLAVTHDDEGGCNAAKFAAVDHLLAVCQEIAEHGTDDWDARMLTLRTAIAKAERSSQ